MLSVCTICITLLSAFALQANAWVGHSDFQRAERFIIPNSEFRICVQRSHDGSLQGSGGVGGLLAVNSYTSTNNSPFSILNSQLDETYLPTYDANGNISEYVTASSGNIVAHYDYSPFGEQIITSGTLADTFTHRFSTKPFCPYTGLIEYQYRKYDPELGRWLSRDPIEESGGVNLYVMCVNNMMKCRDFFGMTSYTISGDMLDMLIAGLSKTDHIIIAKGSKIYNKLYDEIKEDVANKIKEKLAKEGCVNGKYDISDSYRKEGSYGGKLLGVSDTTKIITAILGPASELSALLNDSQFGPVHYNFWTVGTNLSLITYSGTISKKRNDNCLCDYEFSVQITADIKDTFDFVPDRKGAGAMEKVYNLAATIWEGIYNKLLGASCPGMEIKINEKFEGSGSVPIKR